MNKALKQIIDRQKEIEGDVYINIFAGDDQKKETKIYSTFLNIKEVPLEKIQNEINHYNISSYGIFFNMNPLKSPKRVKDNISKILYIFIDLDDANEDHNNIIKAHLETKGITYSYNSKSGHGYHLLIPVNLETNKENKVKGFLTYLKENVCDKVDIATFTNERLLRAPLSLHNKDKESKELKTLHNHIPTKEEILSNNEIIETLQVEQIKGKKDLIYTESIKKDDIFFSTILENKHKWDSYYELLNNSKDRNSNFIKNLGFFINIYPDKTLLSESFLSNWEKSRIPAMHGWAKKSKESNMTTNYYELLKWSKENNLTDFISLLIKQTSETFLDEYEVYYLEDEKNENNCLLYYPNKNYYVQKSIQDVILNIFYDCKERGIDIVKELNLDMIHNKWEEFSHKKQMNLVQDQIRRILEQENRIKMVFNINYEPTENKFIYFDKKKFFNTYNKTTLWDYNNPAKVYHFPKIKELILNLVGNEESSYTYLNNWLGWQIQNPTEKLPTAIIFQGRQGSGKGTFKTHILDGIFGSNIQEINQTHLESSFNEYLLGKQIIVANEVMHNDNRQTLPNVLKNLVTDPMITISRKFRKEIVGKNHTHWIFCTNSYNPIKIDEDDRRYSVFYSEKLKGGGKAAAIFVKELQSNLDYELKEYISYLKSLKIDYSDVHEPIETEAKKEIVELNKDSIHKFKDYLQQFKTLPETYTAIYGHLETYNKDNSFGDGEEYILTDNFYLLYEKWCENSKERGIFSKQNFSKKISSLGCKSLPKWKDTRTFRMYKISDIENLMRAKNE